MCQMSNVMCGIFKRKKEMRVERRNERWEKNQKRFANDPFTHTQETYVRTALYPPEKFNARPSLIG